MTIDVNAPSGIFKYLFRYLIPWSRRPRDLKRITDPYRLGMEEGAFTARNQWETAGSIHTLNFKPHTIQTNYSAGWVHGYLDVYEKYQEERCRGMTDPTVLRSTRERRSG